MEFVIMLVIAGAVVALLTTILLLRVRSARTESVKSQTVTGGPSRVHNEAMAAAHTAGAARSGGAP